MNKGLRIAKKHLFKIFVADVDVGELKTLQKYKSAPGVPKPVPAEFWEKI